MNTSQTTLSFNVSPKDRIKITAAAKRAEALASKYDAEYPMLEAMMDITACHCNGMLLDLDKLLIADDFNFAHDVFGIHSYLNRTTGKLEWHFVPRCALPECNL